MSRPLPAAWLLPLTLLLCAAAWGSLTQAGYAWDDNGLLRANSTLDQPTLEAIFGRDFWYGVRGKPDPSPYYRPLVILSFLVDHRLGLQPAISHLINVALHLLNVALLHRLLLPRLTPARAAAAALIFGLHPIQSEAVAWVSSRSDLMATAGLLGALLLLDRGAAPARFAAIPLASLPLAAAMLSKESSALAPLLLLGWRLAWEEGDPGAAVRRAIREWGLLLPGLLLPLALRAAATLGAPPDTEAALSDALPALPRVAAAILGWLALPWPLTTGMTTERAGLYPWLWPSAALSLAGIGWLLARSPRRSAGLLLLAALSFAPAIPSILWFGLIGERYLYLPMAALAAAVAAAAPARAGALLPIWAVGALWALHVRLPDWADTESLWRAALPRVPDSSYLHQMLGNELLRQGRRAEALEAFDRSLDFTPARRFACENVSALAAERWPADQLLARLPVWDAAGCRRREGYDGPIYLLLAATGRWDQAEARLRSGVRLDPQRRDRVLKGAIALRDGDLLLAGAEAVAWPGGAGAYREQVAVLLLDRP